jgi:trigger factor
VTLEGELPHEELSKHRSAALSRLGADIELPGFRKGHVPEKMLLSHVGEGALLEEMAQRALAEHYPKMLAHHDIDAIGRPDVSVTKLAPGNPLGFKIETAVVPNLTLPDYTAIAKKHVEAYEYEQHRSWFVWKFPHFFLGSPYREPTPYFG